MEKTYCYKMTKIFGDITTVVFQKIEKGRKHRCAFALFQDKLQDIDFSSLAYPFAGFIEYEKDKKTAIVHGIHFKDISEEKFEEESQKISQQFFSTLKMKSV